jgi:hypothetical protein
LGSETRQLREVLVSQLQGLADTKDGSLPVLRDHLWLSQGDIKRTTQTLNPMLKKVRVTTCGSPRATSSAPRRRSTPC